MYSLCDFLNAIICAGRMKHEALKIATQNTNNFFLETKHVRCWLFSTCLLNVANLLYLLNTMLALDFWAKCSTVKWTNLYVLQLFSTCNVSEILVVVKLFQFQSVF